MAQHLQTITEQYAALYSKADAPEVTSVTLRPKPPLSSNPSGLSVSIARVLSQRISAKPETPAASARGATCDLLDAHFCALDINVGDEPSAVQAYKAMEDMNVRVADSILKDYGGKTRFSGRAVTISCHETNQVLRETLEEAGDGRVLIVDGQASKRCALLGDLLAAKMHQKGWAGVIINGCVRDTEDVGKIPVGVKALGVCPVKPGKALTGERAKPVTFAGITFSEGDWIYADADGVVVSEQELIC